MVTKACSGCQRLETGQTVTLHDGRVVCNYCPDYRVECEARELLMKPLSARRSFLVGAERARGLDAVNQLKEIMQKLHAKGKK